MWHRITEGLVNTGGLIQGPLHAVLGALFYAVFIVAMTLSVVFLLVALVMVLAGRGRTKNAEMPGAGARLPAVTVQIPTYNELAALNCARRCLAFDYPADKVQILIGDDSNDSTVSALLAKFGEEHRGRVSILRRGTNAGYKAGNLNNMLQYSTGEYILVFDSDFLPEPDFLKKMVAPVVADREIMAVQAKWRVSNMNKSWAVILGAGIICTIHELMLPFMKLLRSPVPLCGSAELVRKDELIRQGMWKSGALTEDIDYWCRLIKARRRTAFLENTWCLCEVPHTPRDLFRQQMRWAYGVTRSFVDHGREMFLARKVQWRTKASAALFASGYVMVACVVPLIVLGVLNAMTDPGLAAGAQSWQILAIELARSILITGGLIIATISAGLVSGFGFGRVTHMLFSSLTIGLLLVVFISVGIGKAVTGQSMPWFMLKKAGNLQRL